MSLYVYLYAILNDDWLFKPSHPTILGFRGTHHSPAKEQLELQKWNPALLPSPRDGTWVT